MKPYLIISEEVLDAIIKHSNIDNTRECGGYLFGRIVEQNKLTKIYVDGYYYEPNRRGTDHEYVFSILYEMNVKNYATSKGLNLLGCYHSHAQYNAIFSQTDRNSLEKHWHNNKLVMIYSPSYNKLICDFVKNGKALVTRILVKNNNNEIIRVEDYLKKQEIQKNEHCKH